MRRIYLVCILIHTTLLLTSCENNNTENPDTVLKAYFTSIVEGDYERMAELYGGGGYDHLADYNGDVDQTNHAELLRRYCTRNGGQIVDIKQIVKRQKIDDTHYEYQLILQDMEGHVFDNGATYTYTVQKLDGLYQVMELPPYIA